VDQNETGNDENRQGESPSDIDYEEEYWEYIDQDENEEANEDHEIEDSEMLGAEEGRFVPRRELPVELNLLCEALIRLQ
jgi:hypothetical protein